MSKQKITEYRTLGDEVPSKLDEEVNKGIKEGWQPLGGVCIDSKSGVLLQAMVKYEQCEVEDE